MAVSQSLSSLRNPILENRRQYALTPDNADAVLSSCFDISGFMRRLHADPVIALDERTFFSAMKDCVKDSEVRKFGIIIHNKFYYFMRRLSDSRVLRSGISTYSGSTSAWISTWMKSALRMQIRTTHHPIRFFTNPSQTPSTYISMCRQVTIELYRSDHLILQLCYRKNLVVGASSTSTLLQPFYMLKNSSITTIP
jgi:hypothetical protein